jgi:hypothetical protein
MTMDDEKCRAAFEEWYKPIGDGTAIGFKQKIKDIAEVGWCAAWNARQQEPVSLEECAKAAQIFRDGLSRFQKEFWDSYYFPPQGQFNIAEMQRLDLIIINALIKGDDARGNK